MIVKGFILFHLVLFVISTLSMMFYSDKEEHKNTLIKEAVPFYKEHFIKYFDNSDWLGIIELSFDILLRYTAMALHEIWHFTTANLIGIFTAPLYFSGYISYNVCAVGITYHGKSLNDNSTFSSEGRNHTRIQNKANCEWAVKLISCSPFLFWAFFTILFFIQAFANFDILSGVMAAYLIITWKLEYITLSKTDLERTWEFFTNFYFSNPNHFKKDGE